MKELLLPISYQFLETLRLSGEQYGISPVQHALDFLANSLFCESKLIPDEKYEKKGICTDSSVDSVELILPLSDELYSALEDSADSNGEEPAVFAKELIAQELGFTEDAEIEDSLESIGYSEESLLMELFNVSSMSDLDDALDSYLGND